MAGRLAEESRPMLDRAALRIGRPIIEPCDPGTLNLNFGMRAKLKSTEREYQRRQRVLVQEEDDDESAGENSRSSSVTNSNNNSSRSSTVDGHSKRESTKLEIPLNLVQL